jgi:rubrerythrin
MFTPLTPKGGVQLMVTLTLAQAVRNAMEAERAAARFYQELADRADDARTRKFFQNMVEVERQHFSEVEEVGRQLVEGTIPVDPNTDVTVIETAPEWTQIDWIDIDEALQLALECEQRACLFYGALADHFPSPGAEFFRTLSGVEKEHARMLQAAINDRLPVHRSPMTMGQAVRNAIAAERASAVFYRTLARRVQDPAARKFFLDMVSVEHLHAAEIERISDSLKHGPLAERANEPVDNVETPPSWSVGDDPDIDLALRVALEAERHAALYYANMAGHLEGPDADFFRSLARTEEEHAAMIGETLRKRAMLKN